MKPTSTASRRSRGTAFDKAYVNHEVAYHEQVLAAVDKTLIPGATNAELKALLVKVRPAFASAPRARQDAPDQDDELDELRRRSAGDRTRHRPSGRPCRGRAGRPPSTSNETSSQFSASTASAATVRPAVRRTAARSARRRPARWHADRHRTRQRRRQPPVSPRDRHSVRPADAAAGPLTREQTEIIRQWIDEGAVWPDAARRDVAAAGRCRRDAPDARDPQRRSRRHRRAAARPAARGAMSRGAGGSTPLMTAALNGDAALVKRLLEAGADPNAANGAGATALMWAAPDQETMRSCSTQGPTSMRDRRIADRRSPSPAAASGRRRRCGCCSSTAPIRRRGARPMSRHCARRRVWTMRRCSARCSSTAPA